MYASRTQGSLILSTVLAVFLVGMVVLSPHSPAVAKEKIKITKLDDLPRHTYTVSMKPSEMFASDEQMNKLAADVKKDIIDMLDTYEIEDNNTLQKYYGALQTLAFMDGDYANALKYLDKVQALEAKEAKRLVSGLFNRSYIDAIKKTKDPTSDAFKTQLKKNYTARIEALPWETVQEIIEQQHGQMQMISEQLLIGLLKSQMDAAVEGSGFLGTDQALQLIGFRSLTRYILPYKDLMTGVLGDAIAAHRMEKKDIWEARAVTFDGKEGYSPVRVAIWDTGVDVDVFKGRCFTNKKEKMDGKDNDGNGFVDDVHGIAFDLEHAKTLEMLYPLGEQASHRKALEDQLKGFSDLTASIESPESAEIRKKLSTLEENEVKPFIESLSLYSIHAHGTHVAGIAINGNPYAQVLTARLSFDHQMIPKPFTVENTKAFCEAFRQTVGYFKDHGVRVVNMSWGLSLEEYEGNLEANGIGESAEQRADMAREMFDIAKKDMHKSMKGAKDILFVVAAGNSDNDVEFDDFIPSAYDLPNVIVSGAVDKAGEATSFTSYGRTVKVYSNGFEVKSYVPGGREMKLSGTSMASPNVANLAAKLITRDPSLSPAKVVQLIEEGAEDLGKDRPLMVIHPKRSLELLEQRLAKK
jgi:hypothetical protein